MLRTPYEAATIRSRNDPGPDLGGSAGHVADWRQRQLLRLGGNSLLATRLASRLRETFPIEVPLRSLFETTTIRELARLLESLLIEKVDSLSEEEAARLLAGIGQRRPRSVNGGTCR